MYFMLVCKFCFCNSIDFAQHNLAPLLLQHVRCFCVLRCHPLAVPTPSIAKAHTVRTEGLGRPHYHRCHIILPIVFCFHFPINMSYIQWTDHRWQKTSAEQPKDTGNEPPWRDALGIVACRSSGLPWRIKFDKNNFICFQRLVKIRIGHYQHCRIVRLSI